MDEKTDGTGRLCRALYGRDAVPSDYLGGAEAHMLHDAADRIEQSARLLWRHISTHPGEFRNREVYLVAVVMLGLPATDGGEENWYYEYYLVQARSYPDCPVWFETLDGKRWESRDWTDVVWWVSMDECGPPPYTRDSEAGRHS